MAWSLSCPKLNRTSLWDDHAATMTQLDVHKFSLSGNLHAFGWASFNSVAILLCGHNVPCSPRQHMSLPMLAFSMTIHCTPDGQLFLMESSHVAWETTLLMKIINMFKFKQAKVSCTSPILPGTGVGSLVGGAATFWKTNVQLSLLALVKLLSVVKGNRGLK